MKNEGEVWASGRNIEGQLGDGSFTDQHTPVQVHGLYDVDYLNLLTVNTDVHVDALRYLINDAEGGVLTMVGLSYNQTVIHNTDINLNNSGTNTLTFTAIQNNNYLKSIDLTPSSGVIGQATIAMGAQDATGLTNGNVIIVNVNDIPDMYGIGNITINENSTSGPLSFTVSDNTVSDLIVIAESSYTLLIPDENIQISGTTANRTIEITPASDQTGTSCITLTISDGNASFSRSFTVTVNCKPAISSIQNQTTQEDTGIEGISFTVTENNAQHLTITYISSNQNLINNSGLSFTGAQVCSQGNTYTVTASSVGTQVSLTIIPAMNQSGIATITITVASPNGLTATESFDITVQAVDDPPQVTQFISLAAGLGHHLALRADGTVFAWGNNNQGQLGIGSTVDQYTPVPVEGLTDVKQVFAGNDFSMALKHDGTLWAWGNNGVGQLGDNSNIDRTRPVQVSGINDVVQVSLSGNHSLAVKNDNTVWAWGSNTYNVLGLPSGTYHTPTQVKGVDGIGFLTDVIQVSAGSSHSILSQKF
jgi:hypothetical protein